MAGVTDVHVKWDPAAALSWSTGSCTFVNVATRYCVKYIVTIAFDFTVLALTVIGVRRMENTRIGEILIDHGIIYFVLTAFANLVVTVLTILQLSPVMTTLGASPASGVSIVAATRLYVSLHEEAHRPTSRVVTMDQLTSSSFRKKIASFFRLGGGNDGGARRGSVVVINRSHAGTTGTAAGTVTGVSHSTVLDRTYIDMHDLEKCTSGPSPARVSFPSGILIERSLEVHHDAMPATPLSPTLTKSACDSSF